MDDSAWRDAVESDEELDREWTTRFEAFKQHGYRDGMDAGKAASAQAGFDSGFEAGLQYGRRLGHVSGKVQSWATGGPALAAHATDTAESLRGEVSHKEKALTVALCHQAMCRLPQQAPDGCQQRLEQEQVGLERWQELARAVGLNLEQYHPEAELQALEARIAEVSAAGEAHGQSIVSR